MEESVLKKIVDGIKPGEKFLITFISPVETTKEFRELSGGCTIGKLTGVTTVTGMEYGKLDSVIKAKAERAAKVAAGEAKPVQHRESPYVPVVPNTLYRGKANGKLYLALYPTECWKNSFSNYCIFDPNGEIQEQYDTWEEIRDFVSPSWAAKHTAPADGQPFNLQPFIPKPADRIYDIMVGGYGESLKESDQNDDMYDAAEEEIRERLYEVSYYCYKKIQDTLYNYASQAKDITCPNKDINTEKMVEKILQDPILYRLPEGKPMSGIKMINYIFEHIDFTLDGTLK